MSVSKIHTLTIACVFESTYVCVCVFLCVWFVVFIFGYFSSHIFSTYMLHLAVQHIICSKFLSLRYDVMLLFFFYTDPDAINCISFQLEKRALKGL